MNSVVNVFIVSHKLISLVIVNKVWIPNSERATGKMIKCAVKYSRQALNIML